MILTAAYRGAVGLAGRGLDFVLAPVPTAAGAATTRLAAGALSCTRWSDGDRLAEDALTDPATAALTAGMLRRLHRADPPAGLPRWSPVDGRSLLERLRAERTEPWTAGPFGERARAAVRARLDDVGDQVERHTALVEAARIRPWVPTHGEPKPANQLRTAAGIVLVDWESLRLAPRERDLRELVTAGQGDLVDADPAMLDLFDLDWRLDEIDAYTRWFRAPHAGTEDDRIALEGLLEELGGG